MSSTKFKRKLGRCLLRFQQYESLLKAVSAHQSFEGPGDRLQSIQGKKVEEFRVKTLGQLVGTFTGSYLSVDAPEPTETNSDDPGEVPSSGWFRFSSSLAMSPEDYAETVNQLRELVALRNELVHHLIEKFDVWTLRGCGDAVAYLDEAYLKVDSNYATLARWANSMQDARARTAEFFASKEWENFFVHGIAPEGTVDWPRATVVELLRDVAGRSTPDGWTNLADAIASIGIHHPDQSPKLYGCSTWRQMLHESKQFEVRRDKGMDASPGVTWYRARGQSAGT